MSFTWVPTRLLMHTDLEKLKSLQEMDSNIARLQAEVAELPRRVAAIESKLAEVYASVEQSKAALKTQELTRRKLEQDVQAEQQKISKYREQSLEVKTNEQYRALQHEIEFSEKAIRGFEDRTLQSMEESERLEKSLKEAEAELERQSAEVAREQQEARARTAQDEAELAEWGQKRAALRTEVDSDSLRHYDKVLALRKTALAEARQQKCTACNVLLRPQVYDEVRTGARLILCDSCNRILYYDPAHEPAPEPPKAARRRKNKTASEEAEVQSSDSAALAPESKSDEPAPVR